MSDSIIQIQNVNKWFGDFQVLKELILKLNLKKKLLFVDLLDLVNLH